MRARYRRRLAGLRRAAGSIRGDSDGGSAAPIMRPAPIMCLTDWGRPDVHTPSLGRHALSWPSPPSAHAAARRMATLVRASLQPRRSRACRFADGWQPVLVAAALPSGREETPLRRPAPRRASASPGLPARVRARPGPASSWVRPSRGAATAHAQVHGHLGLRHSSAHARSGISRTGMPRVCQNPWRPLCSLPFARTLARARNNVRFDARGPIRVTFFQARAAARAPTAPEAHAAEAATEMRRRRRRRRRPLQ